MKAETTLFARAKSKKTATIRGKEFELFPKTMKTMEVDCSGKLINIQIALMPSVASRHPDLYPYHNISLSIHGVEKGVAHVSNETIIAFGFTDNKQPAMAAKVRCFRNSEILIQNIKNFLPLEREAQKDQKSGAGSLL